MKVFISYRRAGGAEIARLLREALEDEKIDVFLDVETLQSGSITQAILAEIDASTHFLIVLTQGSLDGCSEESDWLRIEIARAVIKGKHIVPVLAADFRWPISLPADIRTLADQNGVTFSHEYFRASVERIVRFLKGDKDAPSTILTSIRMRLLQVKGEDETRALLYEIDAFLYDHPQHVEAKVLRHKIARALAVEADPEISLSRAPDAHYRGLPRAFSRIVTPVFGVAFLLVAMFTVIAAIVVRDNVFPNPSSPCAGVDAFIVAPSAEDEVSNVFTVHGVTIPRLNPLTEQPPATRSNGCRYVFVLFRDRTHNAWTVADAVQTNDQGEWDAHVRLNGVPVGSVVDVMISLSSKPNEYAIGQIFGGAPKAITSDVVSVRKRE